VATPNPYARWMDASPIVVAPRWLIIALIWTVPGLIQATTIYAVYSLKGESLSIGEAMLWRMPEWQVWALATPLVVTLARRLPVTKWKNIPIHFGACTVIAWFDVVVYFYCSRLVGQEPFVSVDLLEFAPWMLLKTAFFEMLVYAAVLAVDAVIVYQRRYREASLRLAEAQLDALKSQLHPHFLFNTINAISVLMRKGESASAIRMLGGLSELLRRSLTSLRVELITLDEELDFISRYLEIETTRFPDRLRVAMEIDPDARDAQVPSMILQPIVENAIEHGIAPRVSGGQITIRARIERDRLRIEVRDDGAGIAGDPRHKGHGVGLSNVRKRLAQLYPDNHRFTLEPATPTGAIAILEIPT
jgi:two-component system LytT family sensor kinase